MQLLAHLADERRRHVESRLSSNQMAWLSTVGPEGTPSTVPVWFLMRPDDTIVMYSAPGAAKLRHLGDNPHVSFVLDVTDIGRDVIRFDATASHAPDEPPADQNAAYVAKYTERISALFGSADTFAAGFSAPIVITPTGAHISEPSPGATAAL